MSELVLVGRNRPSSAVLRHGHAARHTAAYLLWTAQYGQEKGPIAPYGPMAAAATTELALVGRNRPSSAVLRHGRAARHTAAYLLWTAQYGQEKGAYYALRPDGGGDE